MTVRIDNYDSNSLIRFGIPSKGRMGEETLEFFKSCGLNILRKNRQYLATIENFENVQIVFQRQEDIIRGVSNGNLAFGIAGNDLIQEFCFNNSKDMIQIHDKLGFGKCTLEVAIPENWNFESLKELEKENKKRIFNVATKFPSLTENFFRNFSFGTKLIKTAGTIEVAPYLGYSDIIVDLISTGATLKDNRLKQLKDGLILKSEATFIANRSILHNKKVLKIAKTFLEYIEATLRAKNFVSVHVNMKGENENEIGKKILTKKGLEGLEGPTIAKIVSNHSGNWFGIHIIVELKNLTRIIYLLRDIGGSGVVVVPCIYIFEGEPERYVKLIKNLEVVK